MRGAFLIAVAVAAGCLPAAAQAKVRRGGFGIYHLGRAESPAPAPRPASPAPPIRTAAADDGGPVPMTTGTTVPVPAPAAAPAKPARPWCPGGRVFGSGTGFCEIN
ncbi:hypothetical protein QA634_26335 [Methylobacterium sp. CB376]|uniref:hypothetical protein n=1 Tax=unclassified Methylobacterium TaxID=2615210 RepID=UPI0002DB6674|nr:MULTISPECIES: hypothetical protein [Methylobacterium]WFT78754.1 hypothetical protein QA634_26335 [Methylobacterium nodulans]